MEAELRLLMSPDVEGDLESFQPDSESYSILLMARIGPRGEEGADDFFLILTSPTALAARAAAQGHLFTHGYLLLPGYDYQTLRQAIETLCERATGPDWPSVVAQLRLYAKWEFESDWEHAPQ